MGEKRTRNRAALTPIMSTTAIEEFAAKTTVPSWARTREWDAVPAMLRRRAFFSAAVSDAQVLSAQRQAIATLLQHASKDGKLYRRDTAINDLQALIQARGLDTGDPLSLTNPAAAKRIKLVLDINRAQAQEYARFKRSSTGGALLAFPAQELIREAPRREPRDWRARWTEAGGQIYSGRMIALKEDPIWTSINRFGNPYPPFDFGSGMGVRAVSRRECLALGVITPDWSPSADPVQDFNARAEASVANVQPSLLRQLGKLFGDAITIARGIARFTGGTA